MNIRRFYLSILIILGAALAVNAQTMSFRSGSTTADESDIRLTSDSTLEIRLSSATWEATIDKSQFTLVDGPVGLEISKVNRDDDDDVTVTLKITADFDADSNNMKITAAAAAHSHTSDITTDNTCAVNADIEVGTLSAYDPATPDESNIDGSSYVRIALSGGERFIHFDTLKTTDFTLKNFPDGITISGVKQDGSPDTDATNAYLFLDYAPGDFDSDSTNCHIEINSEVLALSTATLSTDSMTIYHLVEDVSFTPTNMEEQKLIIAEIELDLDNDTTFNSATLDSAWFKFENFPEGITIESINSDATGDKITIKFDYTPVNDIDADITDARISIRPAALWFNNTDSIPTSNITIGHSIESVAITDSNNLDERSLNQGMIELTLTNDTTLIKNGIIDSTEFVFNNFPDGITIPNGNITSDALGQIITFYLDFDQSKDFDVDVTNASIDIKPSALRWNVDDVLSTGNLKFTAYVENITFTSTPDVALDEYNLNGRKLNIDINDDWILDTLNFDKNDIVLNTGVTNLSIDYVDVIDTNEFDVYLTQPAFEDFDSDESLYITINAGILNYSGASDTDPVNTITATPENPSMFIDPSAALNEYDLNQRSITVTLNQEWLADVDNFDETDFSLVYTPVDPGGITVENFSLTDSTTFSFDFKFDYNDFDSDIELQVSIPGAQLYQSSGDLLSNDTTLIAYVEDPKATLTPDVPLEEYILPGRYIDVVLTDEWIADTSGFDLADLQLSHAPANLVLNGLTITDSISFRVFLDHSYTDFDTDSTLTLLINHGELIQTSGTNLESDTALITAKVENPRAALTTTGLSEYNMQGKTIDVKLTDEWMEVPLLESDVTLVDGTVGLEIDQVAITDSSLFTITLKDTYNDFDTDSLMYISINKDKLLQSETVDLLSDSVTLVHYLENPKSHLSPNTPLNEYNIDGTVITLTMDEDWIIDTTFFNKSDITLVDAPAGIFIDDIDVVDTNSLTIALNDTIIDFDGDSLLRISIDQTKLVQSISEPADLLSDSIPVIHYLENPKAYMTPSSWLREFFLDTMSLDIKFEEERFRKYISINTADFGILNGPAGLSVQSISSLGDSSVTLELAFDGTDFDDSLTNVILAINSEVLIQKETDSLETDPFTIKANIEPVVGDVTITNDTAMIEDVVQATITLAEYNVDSLYTLAAGAEIGGYGLDSMKVVTPNLYNAWFTVAEGGNDYLAPEQVPVTGLKLDDLPVEGITYAGNISQPADLIDANRPVVQSMNIIGAGDKQIGDDVILLISAFEEGLLPEDTTEINGVLMTETNMVFEEIGGGTYTLTYTVETGDANVSPGDLEATVYLRDYAGNINQTDPGIAANVLSVDANVPVINSVTNVTPKDTVVIGDEVTLAISADETGYTLASESKVNGKTKSEGLSFSSAGTTYFVRYPVEENDPVVQAGDLKAKIILEDAAGNKSLVDSTILSNDVAVLTVRPTALLTGNDEICIYDTATLYITLGGQKPFRVKYHDANQSYFIDGIDTEDFILRIDPQNSMSYAIDSVWDGTGNHNTGLGSSVVIVNPLPVVNILNLEPVYAVTDSNGQTLLGEPTGGKFFGSGVITQTSFFSPPEMGLTRGDTNWIRYEYTDINGCFNVDSQGVQIVQADVEFNWPDNAYPTACYLDKSYDLQATNIDGTIGSFIIEDVTTPPGFLTDNGNNTVTFNPSILNWPIGAEDKEFTIRYDYKDIDGVDLFEKIELKIEHFDTTRITTPLQDKQMCTNEAQLVITGNKPEGLWSGPGILTNDDFNGEFNPATADTGTNWIYYTFETINKCVQRDSAMIIVHQAPEPEFAFVETCISSEGGVVTFDNVSDTSGLSSSLTWFWRYGDLPSGTANEDEFTDMRDGSHFYPGSGRRTVTLTAIVDNTGCTDVFEDTKDFGNTPTVGIDWNTECFTGSPITLSGTSVTEDADSTFRWRITDMTGTEIALQEGADYEQLDYDFESMDNYSLEFTAITDKNCFASIVDTIYLRPYIKNITEDAPYSEDFEGTGSGWFAFGSDASPQNSWVLGPAGTSDFPYGAPGTGTTVWYTDLVRKDTFEQSWVTSPCFDFSNMRRPMISLDRKVSSDRDRDGAVLQYTINDGQSWNNIGAVEDGSINWYNTFRVQNGPGGQGEGWTGEFVFDPAEEWKQARHDLDVLIGKPRVQFRIAYGSAGASVVDNEGFAFDNIWIGERSRIVLIEYFTNSGDNFSNDKNSDINDLVKHNPLDVIDIQYHAELEGATDLMNTDNPAPASARSLYYGTQTIPYALLDGGLSDMSYDFDEESDPFDTLDLYTRALVDPAFDIELDVEDNTGSMGISIDLTALEDLPDAEYVVHTVVLERLVNAEKYHGKRLWDTSFQNVVRAMVPNAAGTSLLRSWTAGETESVLLDWTISDKIINKALLTVVVFVQNAETKSVYQTASNDPELNGDPVIVAVQNYMQENELSLVVYPNPARDEAFLVFNEALPERLEIQVYSHTGSLVRNAIIPEGMETFRMDVSGIKQGVYFIRAVQRDRVMGTRRLMIID